MVLAVSTQPVSPTVRSVGDSYELLRTLVERQAKTLEAVYPGLMGTLDLRPIEHWCVWGALLEILEDDLGQVRVEFADYVQRRERVPPARALETATAVHRATLKPHSLADGVALAGREAVRTGFDRCFLAAAMYLCQPGRIEG